MKNRIITFVLILLSGKGLMAQDISPYLSTGHSKAITNILFAKKGTLLITTDQGGKCIVWSFFERREVNNIILNKPTSIQIMNDSVLFCKDLNEYRSLPLLKIMPGYTPGGGASQSRYSIVNKDNRLKLYDKKELVISIPEILNDFTGFSINADESFMAHVCGDQYIIMRPLNNPESYRQIDAGDNIVEIAFHTVIPQLVAVGTQSGEIKVFDIKTGEVIFTLSSDLIKPINITDDVYKRNIVISENNNSYVFDYQNLQLNQYSLPFGKLKANESYLHVFDDSTKKSTVFYWQNNYSLYKYVGDVKYEIGKYPTIKFHDKYVRSTIDLAPHFANPVYLFAAIAGGDLFNYQAYKQVLDFQSPKNSEVSYGLSGKVVVRNGGNKTKYRSLGIKNVVFTQDDSTIVTFRHPAYLNVISKTGKFMNENYYLFDVDTIRLYTVKKTFFILQKPKQFSLLECNQNKLAEKKVLTGVYINASDSGSEFYYKKDTSVIIHHLLSGKESSLKARRDHQVLFIKRICFNDKIYGYLIFYDIGIVEYKTAGNNLIGTFYCYTNGEFIFMLPDNSFYSSSKTLLQKVLLKSRDNIYQLDQFEAEFNRPDLVMKKMQYVKDEKIEIYHEAYAKFTQRSPSNAKIQIGELPYAEIKNWSNNYYTSDSTIAVSCVFKSNHLKLNKINLYINSVPVFGKQGDDISKREINEFDTTFTVKLNKGDNLLKPISISSNGTKNFVKSYYIKAEYKSQPHVYFIGIGANKFADKSYNLEYADKDIASLTHSFKLRYKQTLSIDTLFNRRVTMQSIRESLEKLKNINVNDKVIIYYSGHGLLSSKGGYYLSDYDVNFDNPEDGGIFYSDIKKLIDQIPSRYKIFFIDACHSGAIENTNFSIKNAPPVKGKKGVEIETTEKSDNSFYLMQDLFSDFSQGSGTIVISASRGNQSALESKKWDHGAFTYSILQGLENNRADLNKDGKISISELKNYVSRKVIEITNGDQRPTARKDVLDYDWAF